MTTQTKQTITAKCPGCSGDIFFYRNPKLGEFVTCPMCRDMVAVVSLSPLTLDWSADIEDEDWPDWDGYDEEYLDAGVP